VCAACVDGASEWQIFTRIVLPLDGEGFYKRLEPATQILKAGIEKAGLPLDAVIHATGHTHIDVAWLWTLGQTRRKAERTFYIEQEDIKLICYRQIRNAIRSQAEM
jgi:glycosyl hydrolase family 38